MYTYDALGRRIQVKDARASADAKYKRFYYDGQRVLLETTLDDDLDDQSEADDRYYVYGNYIDEVLLMTDNLAATAADHYYGHDHLFSTTVLFDASGDIEERYEYNAYGKCTVLDADLTADADGLSDFKNPYLYTGRKLDILDENSFKIQYSRARYYDSETGRFLQRDPLMYVDGMNLYEYVSSMAILFTDAFGLAKDECECGEFKHTKRCSVEKDSQYVEVYINGTPAGYEALRTILEGTGSAVAKALGPLVGLLNRVSTLEGRARWNESYTFQHFKCKKGKWVLFKTRKKTRKKQNSKFTIADYHNALVPSGLDEWMKDGIKALKEEGQKEFPKGGSSRCCRSEKINEKKRWKWEDEKRRFGNRYSDSSKGKCDE